MSLRLVFSILCLACLTGIAPSAYAQTGDDAAYQAMVDKIMSQHGAQTPDSAAPDSTAADTTAPMTDAPAAQLNGGGFAAAGDGPTRSTGGNADNNTGSTGGSVGDAMKSNTPAKQQSYVVTSMKSCYDQLPPDVAQNIKLHSLHPYEDCQRALSDKQSATQHYSAALEAAKLTPETPRNFVRVITPGGNMPNGNMQGSYGAGNATDNTTLHATGGHWSASHK